MREFARPLEGDRGLFIDDLYVTEDARGKGIGHALIDAARKRAEDRHLGVVQWITAHDNDLAKSVYDSVAERTSWVTYEIDLQKAEA
jgi:ribosomal protein S18 acetylase RimI-like enzyme